MRTAPRTWPQMCLFIYTWWRHQIETISALLALCVGNSPVTGEFPSQRPVTRGFDIFFDLRPNKRLSKQSRRCWFETPACSLWRHCNEQQRTQDWLQNFGGVFVKLPSEIIILKKTLFRCHHFTTFDISIHYLLIHWRHDLSKSDKSDQLHRIQLVSKILVFFTCYFSFEDLLSHIALLQYLCTI